MELTPFRRDHDGTVHRSPVRGASLKNLAAGLATHPLLARVIAWHYRDVIPFHGGRVDLRGLNVPARNKAALFWGLYESAEYRFVRDHLSASLPVIELGSSLGAIASVIARKLGRHQRLICVEANPSLPQAIERTLAHNAPHLHVEVVNAAIGYHRTHVDFRVSEDNLCSSAEDGRATRVFRVPSITLAELVSRLGNNDYQLVADIEGAEAAILTHDRDALSRCRTAILELHATEQGGRRFTPDDLVAVLRSLGFDTIHRYGPVVACRRLP